MFIAEITSEMAEGKPVPVYNDTEDPEHLLDNKDDN